MTCAFTALGMFSAYIKLYSAWICRSLFRPNQQLPSLIVFLPLSVGLSCQMLNLQYCVVFVVCICEIVVRFMVF